MLTERSASAQVTRRAFVTRAAGLASALLLPVATQAAPSPRFKATLERLRPVVQEMDHLCRFAPASVPGYDERMDLAYHTLNTDLQPIREAFAAFEAEVNASLNAAGYTESEREFVVAQVCHFIHEASFDGWMKQFC